MRRKTHPGPAPLAALCLLALIAGGCGEQSAAPRIGQKGKEPKAAASLGFPEFATKNTTRVGGADEVADAAGVALAVFPSRGGVPPPAAVSLVERGNWHAGIAASVLFAPPLRAPLLLSDATGMPGATRKALEALAPKGSNRAREAQVVVVGDVPPPAGLRAVRIAGHNPSRLAAAIDRFRATVTGGRSDRVIVVSQEQPAFAMPAAAWAARSGDPVLFVGRHQIPRATRSALRRHHRPAIYVLGPRSAVSASVLTKLRPFGRSVKRIAGENPVDNAVAFARYLDGSFGWNVNDPGHGLVIANSTRPLDAAAAAPLSASGTYGPLLLTDNPLKLPAGLERFLLDVKPGYRDDPSRAVYNHVWLIGGAKAIDPAVQAQIDDLAEVTRVRPPAQPGL